MKLAPARMLAGAAAAVFALAIWHHERHAQRVLHTGDRLIPLSVVSLQGEEQTLPAQGALRVINIFATWCGPCREETPQIAAAADRLAPKGVEVIGIDQEESVAQVALFGRAFHLPYPLYVDSTGVTHDVLGARIIPTTLLIDRQGVIRWEHAGPLTSTQLVRAVQAVRENG